MKSFLVELCLLIFIFVSSTKAQDALPEIDIITPDNIGEITQLATLGTGGASQLDWHPSGEIVAFGGGWGVWLLDESYQMVAHFTNIPQTRALIWHPSEGMFATLHTEAIRLWRITPDFSAAVLDRELLIPESEWRYRGRGAPPPSLCLAWSPNHHQIAIGIKSRELPESEDYYPRPFLVFDLSTETPVAEQDASIFDPLPAQCRPDALNPDGTLRASMVNEYQVGYRFSHLQISRVGEAEPFLEMRQTFEGWRDRPMVWKPDGSAITMIIGASIVEFPYPNLNDYTSHTFFNGWFNYISWSPDGQHLLAGDRDIPKVGIWTLGSDGIIERKLPLNFARNGGGGLGWAEDSRHLIARTNFYGYDRIDLFDFESWERMRSVATLYDSTTGEPQWCRWNDSFTRCAYFDDETQSVTVSVFPDTASEIMYDNKRERYVMVSENGDYIPVSEVRIDRPFPNFLWVEWKGDQLFIRTSEDGVQHLYRWDATTNLVTEEIFQPSNNRPLEVEWRDTYDQYEVPVIVYTLILKAPEGETILGTIPDQLCHQLRNVQLGEGGIVCTASAVHPDSPMLAITVKGGIRFWSLVDGSLLGEIHTTEDIATLSWQPGGNLLAASSDAGVIYLFGVPAN